MLGSSQGGMNIEEVARDMPEALITQPVDIHEGIKDEQAATVADFMGFEGDQKTQVTDGLVYHILGIPMVYQDRSRMIPTLYNDKTGAMSKLFF